MHRLILLAVLALGLFAADAAAYYSPHLGRWITRDPAGYVDGGNLYEYGRSDPAMHRDPMGLGSIGDAVRAHCRSRCKHISDLRFQKCILQCKSTLSRQERFDLWYEQELNDKDWLAKIPECPSEIPVHNGKPMDCDSKVWDGFTKASEEFHPGTKWCMRSKSFDGHAQQCCYDENGKLATMGLGAGTPDRQRASFLNGVWLRHYFEDVEPFKIARDLDGGVLGDNLEKYLEVRPPSQGGGACCIQ